MQEKIFSAIAIAIVVIGCVWGWWIENGPQKDNHISDRIEQQEIPVENPEEMKTQNNMGSYEEA